MNIHVSNLSANVIGADLKRLFAIYGEVMTAVIIKDGRSGHANGTALIDMLNAKHASQAIVSLDNSIVDGKAISVHEIKYSVRNYTN
jgi:RNA recognition motif-containing protein